MDALVKELETKLNYWTPEIVLQVKSIILEVIEIADHDALDLIRSRIIEKRGIRFIR